MIVVDCEILKFFLFMMLGGVLEYFFRGRREGGWCEEFWEGGIEMGEYLGCKYRKDLKEYWFEFVEIILMCF